MPIPWKPEQAAQVRAILNRYPPQSNQCEQVAKTILPIARELHPRSRNLRIKPAQRARFLLPKIPLQGEWWFHHVTTEVTEHYVDALTQADGTPAADYFSMHFQYPDRDAYLLEPLDPAVNAQ